MYMSGLTNYLALSGYDLSFIFQPGTSSIITGFKLANGNDIGSIFQEYTTGTQASATGLISSGGGGGIFARYLTGLCFRH